MAKYKLLLPKMGESVAEATIIKWTKNPGDYIETDETVIEIATDKVDSDVPSPVSGTLLEQLCKENDVVQVGDVVAIIETDEPDEIKEPEVNTGLSDAVQKEPEPVNEEPQIVDESAAADPIEKPDSASEPAAVTVVDVPVETEQPIFADQRKEFTEQVPYVPQAQQTNTETENGGKTSSRFYSPLVKNIASQEGIDNNELDQIPGTGAEGRLTKDDLLNYIQTRFQPKEDLQTSNATFEDKPAADIEPLITPESESAASESEPTPVAEVQDAGSVNATAHAEPELQVEQPKEQSIFEAPKEEPVKQVISESRASANTSVSGNDEIIEMDRMRRLIADHMIMSKQTSPHVTSFVEADVTNLVLWREKVKTSFEKREGEKITFTPIFIEAVVKAIRDFPMINISVSGTQIIKKKDINISMATALPSGNLIVPVIKRADELSLLGLTKAVNDLANRARINKLKPDDVQGGTFTITNVGSFGNVMGTPIINQPQVAILAVGAIKKKPAVIETPQGDAIGIRHMMFLSLSYDHRVVDGALGGSFIKRVADYLESWDKNRTI